MKHALNVLVVDDSDFQADVLVSILEDFGITEVTKAVNGLDALKQFEGALLRGTPYSLVFLDIMMPEMDGQEALKRMRMLEKAAGISDTDKTVIIMTTSLSSPDDMMTAILEGDCTDYVVKPVAGNILKATLIKYRLLD